MSKRQLRFFFDFGGCCLWGDDGVVKYKSLPISENLKNELNSLNDEFDTSINWDDPREPSPWTKEHFADFLKRATLTYEKLKIELGSDFEVANELNLNKPAGNF